MTENKQEILKKAKELLELSYGHDQSNRKEMKTDLLFSTGFQWSKREIEERGDRPTLTVDKLNQHLKLATGDIRNNPPAIDVFPNDNKSDVKTAKTYTELIRQIEYQSNASFIYSYAGQMAASCGLGAWRLDTKYIDDSTFEQEIKLRHIPNPLSVFFDSLAIEPDKSDVKYVFVTEMMNERDFKEKYPGKKVVSVEQKDPSGDDFLWGGQEKIRVAEYWYKKPVKKHLVQLVDGTTKDVTEEIKSKADLETLKRHPDVAAYRHADSEEVHQVVISGDEILSGPVKWPGKYIPIFIVPGDETPLEDKTHRSSVIRRARDPQKIYNYNRSAAIEHIGMANKQPFLATVKQVGKYLGQWKNANQSNASVLLYEPDPDVPGGKPSVHGSGRGRGSVRAADSGESGVSVRRTACHHHTAGVSVTATSDHYLRSYYFGSRSGNARSLSFARVDPRTAIRTLGTPLRARVLVQFVRRLVPGKRRLSRQLF